VILTWASVPGATSYKLYWDNVTGVSDNASVISGITSNNYIHTGDNSSGLLNGRTYYYKLSASNSSGESDLSEEKSATPILPAPKNLTATAGKRKVGLTWTPVSRAISYNLYYDNSSGIDLTPIFA
jgi:hypothetical protein